MLAVVPDRTSSATHSPTPSLQGLFSRQPIEKFAAGTAVFWEGDAASHVFEVVEGVLRVFKIMSDGRRVITGFVYPGDLLGVSLKNHYLYTAEAVTRTKLRRFARNRFQDEINAVARTAPATLRPAVRRDGGRPGPDGAPRAQKRRRARHAASCCSFRTPA